jgi:hypothetical protein
MFMAYPGVFLVDDQQIFKAMLRAGELGGLITMHAAIGLPIDVLVKRALAAGHNAPENHALTRPEGANQDNQQSLVGRAPRCNTGCLLSNAPIRIAHALQDQLSHASGLHFLDEHYRSATDLRIERSKAPANLLDVTHGGWTLADNKCCAGNVSINEFRLSTDRTNVRRP